MAKARRPTPAQLQRLVRLPGTARRYRDPRTGAIFTDRAVRGARSASGKSREQDLLRARLYRALEGPRAQKRPSAATIDARIAKGSTNNFDSLVDSYMERRRQIGKPVTRAQAVSARSPFWRAFRDLEHAPRTYRRGGKVFKAGPKSRAARALVDLGLRAPNQDYRVGESPKAVRSASSQIRETFRARVTGRQ